MISADECVQEEAVVASADSARDMQAASQAKAAVAAAEARAQEAEDDLKRQELSAKKADCVEVAKEDELHQLAASATKRAATARQKARDEKQQVCRIFCRVSECGSVEAVCECGSVGRVVCEVLLLQEVIQEGDSHSSLQQAVTNQKRSAATAAKAEDAAHEAQVTDRYCESSCLCVPLSLSIHLRHMARCCRCSN